MTLGSLYHHLRDLIRVGTCILSFFLDIWFTIDSFSTSYRSSLCLSSSLLPLFHAFPLAFDRQLLLVTNTFYLHLFLCLLMTEERKFSCDIFQLCFQLMKVNHHGDGFTCRWSLHLPQSSLHFIFNFLFFTFISEVHIICSRKTPTTVRKGIAQIGLPTTSPEHSARLSGPNSSTRVEITSRRTGRKLGSKLS